MAGQSILIGLLPALVAGIVFFKWTEPEPFLEWAAGPCAFIVVLRGIRRASGRILIRRFFTQNQGSYFIGRATNADRIRPGAWVRLNDTHAARVIAAHTTDGLRSLVLTDGATLTADSQETLESGIVVGADQHHSPLEARLLQRSPQRKDTQVL